MRVYMRVACAGLVLMPLLAILGCSDAPARAKEESNLKPIAVFYGRYKSRHRGQPPANEAEFKAFLKSQSADLASLFKTDPEKVLVSPRDGKPVVILYGPVKGPAGPGGSPVVVYEQEGQGGKRFVASELGAVEEVDQARFDQLVPTKGR